MSFRSAIRTGLAFVLLLLAFAACGPSDESVRGPAVPHEVSNRDDGTCRLCHADPASGAPQSPHPKRNQCTACHAVGAGQLVPAPGVPHHFGTTEAEYCRVCHRAGLEGAPKSPHPDRNQCTACHVPDPANETFAPWAHDVTAATNATCLGCHAAGAGGEEVMPHAARPHCVWCHVVMESQVTPAAAFSGD
jgi:hypothetical protein